MKKTTSTRNIATFSIVGRSKDGKQIGVAVASKFLAVGSYVPSGNIYGALATQANTNLKLKVEGLSMLENGIEAKEILDMFFAVDEEKETRQAGIVDSHGNAATFTGGDCKPWAGGRAEQHEEGSYAIQGNLLQGPEVLDAIVDSWENSGDNESLSWRLLDALEAGENAGGDSRGRQASALIVIEKESGYNGLSDIAVDLRCDDSEAPIDELKRLLRLHDEFFCN